MSPLHQYWLGERSKAGAPDFGIGPDFGDRLRNLQWKTEGYERQAKMLTDYLVELLDNRLTSQRTNIAFSSAKLQYLSQNHLRGTAYVIVLFLPGIFVSSLIAAGIFGENPGVSYLVIWLAFALPFTFVAIAILQFLWIEPVLKERLMEHFGVQEGFWSRVSKITGLGGRMRRKSGPDTESVLRKGEQREPPTTVVAGSSDPGFP
ncbi:hypothetical protein LTR96_003505 [Exophiala xenobiotica]|nr:hypothetical protein LTR92_001597 [Exophiala xenobiotica]KAK5271678.1 hypothetical protein LTR96_003505 [Exophiala xenobiotica]KAK5342913.1 hypothetical protein LTR98_000541 [Exophiala xenobiotica]KAK5555937.1 hypothetical protein LTR46_005783 [Exophiala xenobiotica]